MAAIDTTTYRFTHTGRFGIIALAVGVIGTALTIVGYFTDSQQFFASWLMAFSTWTTIALGALFFVMLQHVTGAIWSVTTRRAAEAMTQTFPLLLLFFLPVLFGVHSLFHWSHEEELAVDHLLAWKAPYLNATFFSIRGLVFFAIWIVLAWLLTQRSLRQDGDGDVRHTIALRKISAVGLFLFTFSLTFAALDWLMSLEPHWYSTMFGVYVFAGGFLAALAALSLFFQLLGSRGLLTKEVSIEHHHDFGRLLFAFTVFWAYIGGSQYYLIWYANIPEETMWYLARWDNGWHVVSIALILLHFAVPFFTLIFFRMKRTLPVLRIITLLILVMHAVDMYWLVMPTFRAASPMPVWTDFTALAGLGGLALWLFWRRYTAHAAVPLNDPKFHDSVAHNV
jgi:hypothetical protein